MAAPTLRELLKSAHEVLEEVMEAAENADEHGVIVCLDEALSSLEDAQELVAEQSRRE